MKHAHRGFHMSALVLGALALAPGCLSTHTFTDRVLCASDAECDDGNPCTADACNSGRCAHTSTNVGMTCGQGAMTCNGAGQCAACSSDAECGATTQCASYACTDNTCKVTLTAATAMLNDTTKGDCKRPQCDGKGTLVEVPDTADAPSSGSCAYGTCNGEMPVVSFSMSGMPCSGSNGVCDGNGACVECLMDTNCDPTSLKPYCDTSSRTCFGCYDGVRDGDETGVDCGGTRCYPCNGSPCQGGHCASFSCVNYLNQLICGLFTGAMCMYNDQCASLYCKPDGTCQ